MEDLIKAYEDLGRKWLNNEVYIESFGQIQLTPNQQAFVNDKTSELLISGGYRSGKTLAMIVKMYLLSMFFPNNQILLGRKSLSDIRLTLIPAIQDIFPAGTYEYKPGYNRIDFPNGSQIHLLGLDTQVGGDDTKKATQKIRGLDLGAAFIDQLEEIEQLLWDQLAGRMSRKVPFHQKCATTNPARFWAYEYFKANPRPNTKLIETGMEDNKANLPEGFIESQLTKGEMYVKRFVYGVWDDSTMVDGRVFSSDIDKDQAFFLKEPIRTISDIKIFLEPENHEYQIGIDPSTGAEDPCAIVCVDKTTGDIVATYSGFVPTHVITAKAIILAELYSKVKKPLIVPEVTGVGQALIEDLKKQYDKIYEREVFSKRESKKIDKLGFSTNYATKLQLIENMQKLFQSHWPKLRDKKVYNEFQVFAWMDEARKQGAGAPHPYHDDMVMATMLAYWDLKPVEFRKRNLLQNSVKTPTQIRYEYQ